MSSVISMIIFLIVCYSLYIVHKNDDYDEDFQSSSESSVSTPKNENKEASVEEDLDDLDATDLLASQSSKADTMDKSTSNSSLGTADHVEKL